MTSVAKKSNSIFSPIIVLVCIALVASFMLAGVYQLTNPVIQAREKETMSKALSAVLPKASSFSQRTDVELYTDVLEVYEADNGAGIVCTTNCKSQQGGAIKMMIGVDSFGKVSGISVISHNETAGLGDKALAQDYLQNYFGKGNVDEVSAVDAMSGVTKTSNAVKLSCQAALNQFIIVSKSNNPVVEKTVEQQLAAARAAAFPNVANFTLLDLSKQTNVISIYQAADNAGYVFYIKSTKSAGLTAVVAVNGSGEVCYMQSIENPNNISIGMNQSDNINQELVEIAVKQYNAIK